MTADNWRTRARCDGSDGELFYPVSDLLADTGKAICAACPVRQDCLNEALATGEQHGIWGGLTAKERRRIARHKTPQERRREQITALVEAGETTPTIAQKIGMTPKALRSWCLAHSIHLPGGRRVKAAA